MKKKKIRTLKQQIKYAEEMFFEENRETFEKIVGDHFDKQKKQKKKNNQK